MARYKKRKKVCKSGKQRAVATCPEVVHCAQRVSIGKARKRGKDPTKSNSKTPLFSTFVTHWTLNRKQILILTSFYQPMYSTDTHFVAGLKQTWKNKESD